MTDSAARTYFHSHQIEPEYIGGGYTVLMASPFNRSVDWRRLEKALEELAAMPRSESAPVPLVFELPEAVMPPHEAVFADSETVPLDSAVGKVAAQTVITCPPGVPVVVPGEKITPQAEIILKNSGNFVVKVVK